MTPEGRVETHLVSQCKKRGILYYKFTAPANSGVPDRIVIGNGKVIFIELKAPGEKPRKLQRYVIAKMRKAGADVRVADSNELVDAILSEVEVKEVKNNEKNKKPH